MKKLLIVIYSIIFVSGCASSLDNRNPLNETFPTISAKDLNEQSITLPEDLKGDLSLLLIGYKQRSQFDIDRWLIALDMTETQVTAYELPTISGMLPKMFKPFIDGGMRKGIPKSMWGGVITVYDDAAKVTTFTGTENPGNARVLLINKQGKVLYFYDQGFAVDALNALRDVIDTERHDV